MIPIVTADGQILIQRGKGNNSDDANHKDSTNESSADASMEEKILDGRPALQTREEEGQQQVRYSDNIDEPNKSILEKKEAEVIALKIKVRELETTKLELSQVIDQLNQFRTADTLSKSKEDLEKSKDISAVKDDVAEFEEYKTYREVSEYVIPFYRLGNSTKIPFAIRVDFSNRKLLSFQLGKVDQFRKEDDRH